jgi:hypothetical protein
MWKKILVLLLSVSLLLESLLAAGGFFARELMLTQFKLGYTPDSAFMGFVLAWLLLFVAIICGLALKLVLAGDRAGWTLSRVLGVWWVGIGVGLYLGYGRIDNLFMDSLKGALILLAARLSRAEFTHLKN